MGGLAGGSGSGAGRNALFTFKFSNLKPTPPRVANRGREEPLEQEREERPGPHPEQERENRCARTVRRDQAEQERREAQRRLWRLQEQIKLLSDVIRGYSLTTRSLRSLVLAALLLALFLELLGWFILVGLFATFLIYLLLIIRPTRLFLMSNVASKLSGCNNPVAIFHF
ncbi:hypothetical protein GALMADRAFT_1075138 [Galerina marginata CBS 339.88]|uniref:Uncharacterized protein n=1 Tax=Galerina marginata (strain CBS 339.88) TaxID=685588 RepID=A0A067SLR2_GALM3|nr:hypothetical protein GALMADRAFT_1075138 [Galerina marginata CBS 339.88]